jgi:preprotein translocase subunit SecA
VDTYAQGDPEGDGWDLDALKRELTRVFALEPGTMTFGGLKADDIRDELWTHILASYQEKEGLVPPDVMRRVERDVMLQIVDTQWKDHLYSLDHLKDGIGLRGYGQRDPLVEYKKESFALFQAMKDRVDEEIVRYLWWLKPVPVSDQGALVPRRPPARQAPIIMNDPVTEAVPAFAGAGRSAAARLPPGAVARRPQPARVGGDDAAVKTVRRDEPKVGRNDPCPCGSGRKYKKCHGAAA